MIKKTSFWNSSKILTLYEALTLFFRWAIYSMIHMLTHELEKQWVLNHFLKVLYSSIYWILTSNGTFWNLLLIKPIIKIIQFQTNFHLYLEFEYNALLWCISPKGHISHLYISILFSHSLMPFSLLLPNAISSICH